MPTFVWRYMPDVYLKLYKEPVKLALNLFTFGPPGKPSKYQYRTIQAEYEPFRADPLPSKAGDPKQHVQTGLRRRPPLPPEKQHDLLY